MPELDPTYSGVASEAAGGINPARADTEPVRHRPLQEIVLARETTIPLCTAWDVYRVVEALAAHDNGNFYLSGMLADSMMADDAIITAYNTRVIGLLGKNVKIKPNPRHRDQEAAAKAAEDVAARRDVILAEQTLAPLLGGGLQLGHGAGQLIWHYDGECTTPSLMTWHPSSFYYRYDLRRYVANTLHGPAVVVPGDGQWVMHTPFQAYRGWIRGLLRATAVPYLARQYGYRDSQRYNEVHGLPIKKLLFPDGARESEKQQVLRALGRLASESAIGLPQAMTDTPGANWDLQLLEATSNTWQAFIELIKLVSDRIAIAWLGQNLTTMVDGGSLAAAEAHNTVRTDYALFDSRTLGHTVREQILRPFCDYNYGDETLAPYVEWEVLPPENAAQAADSAGKALTAASVAATVPDVDQRALLAKLQIPLRSLEDSAAAKAAIDAKQEAERPQSIQQFRPPLAGLSTVALDAKPIGERGTDWAIDVAEAGAERAKRAIAPMIREIRTLIGSAKSYTDLRKQLIELYPEISNDDLARVLEQAIAASSLAGAHTVQQEL